VKIVDTINNDDTDKASRRLGLLCFVRYTIAMYKTINPTAHKFINFAMVGKWYIRQLKISDKLYELPYNQAVKD